MSRLPSDSVQRDEIRPPPLRTAANNTCLSLLGFLLLETSACTISKQFVPQKRFHRLRRNGKISAGVFFEHIKNVRCTHDQTDWHKKKTEGKRARGRERERASTLL